MLNDIPFRVRFHVVFQFHSFVNPRNLLWLYWRYAQELRKSRSSYKPRVGMKHSNRLSVMMMMVSVAEELFHTLIL